jgi:hypothetical protein
MEMSLFIEEDQLGTSINNAECGARCLKRPGRRAWQDCRAASASM